MFRTGGVLNVMSAREGTSAGCALLDRSLVITWANDRFTELLPADAPRPIVGHHIREVSPYIEALGIDRGLARVAATGEQFEMDTVTPARADSLVEQWKRSAYRLPTGDVLLVVERLRIPPGHPTLAETQPER